MIVDGVFANLRIACIGKISISEKVRITSYKLSKFYAKFVDDNLDTIFEIWFPQRAAKNKELPRSQPCYLNCFFDNLEWAANKF